VGLVSSLKKILAVGYRSTYTVTVAAAGPAVHHHNVAAADGDE